MSALKTLYIYRKILFSITILGVKSRTSGNILGAAWLIIYPILFLGLYYIVFLRILNVKINGMSNPEYIILIFSGLVPFLSFSEAFSVGTVSVIANRGLLKNTVFPIEIIVAKDVLVSHVCMGIGMLIVWIAVILVNGWKYTQLLVPFVFFMQILLSIGVVWITSTLTVFFRDIQQALPIIILLMMMLSPIAYTPDMVPANIKAWLAINPLSYLMSLYRSLLFGEGFILSDAIYFLVMTVILFKLGFLFISRLKAIFPSYL